MANRPAVIREIIEERSRQDLKWGEQNWIDPAWTSILSEEVGEAAREANDGTWPPHDKTREESTRRLRKELIQVAAVAVAWIEAIDRRDETHKAKCPCGDTVEA